MKQKYFGFSFCVLIFTAGLVVAYSNNPPDGATNAPGEGVCTACHSSFQLNSGNGTLSINAPSIYEPNSTSIITINLSQQDQSKWGFEATALDANNNFVGSFINGDLNRTNISTGIRDYIKHIFGGNDAGTTNASQGWEIHWVAPATNVGPVTIYVSGNAANNNNNTSGDYIYTNSHTLTPDFSNCCIATRGNVDADQDDIVDISDLVYLVDFMFTQGPDPQCLDEANVDGDQDNLIDISDLVYLVDFMFTQGPPPPSCP